MKFIDYVLCSNNIVLRCCQNARKDRSGRCSLGAKSGARYRIAYITESVVCSGNNKYSDVI